MNEWYDISRIDHTGGRRYPMFEMPAKGSHGVETLLVWNGWHDGWNVPLSVESQLLIDHSVIFIVYEPHPESGKPIDFLRAMYGPDGELVSAAFAAKQQFLHAWGGSLSRDPELASYFQKLSPFFAIRPFEAKAEIFEVREGGPRTIEEFDLIEDFQGGEVQFALEHSRHTFDVVYTRHTLEGMAMDGNQSVDTLSVSRLIDMERLNHTKQAHAIGAIKSVSPVFTDYKL